MRALLLSLTLALFYATIDFGDSLKGEVCTRRKTYYVKVPYTRKFKTSYTIETDCRAGFSRCRRTRYYYTQRVQEKYVRMYKIVQFCCRHWRTSKERPDSCDIHDKAPIVKVCRSPQTAYRRTARDQVTWIPPVFKDPFKQKIIVSKTLPKDFPRWGLNTINYIGRNAETKRLALCDLYLYVEPLPPVPKILGLEPLQKFKVRENEATNLTCRANYIQYPPMYLEWTLQGVLINQSAAHSITKYTEKSDAQGYRNTFSNLTLAPTRRDDGAVIQCRLEANTSASFSVRLDVLYEVPPEVTHRPPNQEVVSAKRSTVVKWDAAKFRDPRYNEKISVTTNYGKDVTEHEFGWGKHVVTYTAQNVRNHLRTSYSFIVIVKPPDCKRAELMPIENGGLVCGYSQHHAVQACYPVCADGGGQMWFGDYSVMSMCTYSGKWLPGHQPINCTDVIAGNPCVNTTACQAGTCAGSGLSTQLKTSFPYKMIYSDYNGICRNIDETSHVDVALYCP